MNRLQTENEFLEILNSFRIGQTPRDKVADWACKNGAYVESRLSRTAFLKMKHGKPSAALKELFVSCSTCSSIHPEGRFRSQLDFNACDVSVVAATAAGTLRPIQEPGWLDINKESLGAAGYFRCANCESIWELILPERANSGSWHRVA